MAGSRHSSVRWRIVLIYFILVFLAMTMVSVFLMNRIEDYQLSSLKENITNTISESNLLNSLGKYADLGESAEEIQANLDRSWTAGFAQELSVVSKDLKLCASTNSNLLGRSAAEVFDTDLIVNVLMNGGSGESESVSGQIPVKNFCFAITSEESGLTSGCVFVRADLSSINSFLSQSRAVFMRAILIALAFTFILSFILASSITVPINDVTDTVQKMSQGDFSITVPVKSDDEIGQLAEMFNLLRLKLDDTISEINSEKNKLGTILEYMADGLIAVDLEGNIIHVNPAAKSMLRLKYQKLEDQPYQPIIGVLSDVLDFDHIVESCGEDGGQGIFPFKDEIYALRYDHFKDEAGDDVGIILIMQDITERQKLEDMQTDFVANVSHELKTPLTNIKSYTETLLEGALDDRETAVSFLTIVDSEADRMNRLVKDLLQLSRLDHKQEQMNLKDSNIIPLLNLTMEKMRMSAAQKNQSLEALYDTEGEIRVMIDRDRMEQVIINLLSNAIKYTQEGGAVKMDAAERNGRLYISVEDNGLGIPEASLSRIFERFYRVDKARSRAMGGTGLGLAITKQIVEEHAGDIKAESEEGKGTKMTVSLPLVNRKGVRNIE